jgi:glycosyltransferase involved in cell wall biosynthesis
MRGTIAVFVGSSSSFNIVRAASNIGRALSEEFRIHLISTDKTFVEEVSIYYDDVHGVKQNGSLMGEVRALQSYLRSCSPDVLFQITNPPIHGTIVGYLSTLYDIPFVYRYSGDRFYEYQVSRGGDRILHFGLNNVLGRLPIHLADAHIVLGPTGRKRLENRGVDPSKISVIPPIVNQERFSAKGPSVDLGPGRYTGLFIGRLSRRKGKETLERTLPEILESRNDLHFVFVGNKGEILDVPPEYSRNITFIGPISPTKIPGYYRDADFLMHPSLIEGLPRVVLEALASGIPPIARDVGDIAYATENTFSTDVEFKEMVCNFESLKINTVDRYGYETVSKQYLRLFTDIVQNL